MMLISATKTAEVVALPLCSNSFATSSDQVKEVEIIADTDELKQRGVMVLGCGAYANARIEGVQWCRRKNEWIEC